MTKKILIIEIICGVILRMNDRMMMLMRYASISAYQREREKRKKIRDDGGSIDIL
jgi:hypothetical protein